MPSVHGKDLKVSVDADDISPYTNQFELEREAEAHDDTGFGAEAKTYKGGLKDGTATAEGTYHSGATGPAAILEPLLGTTVEVIYQPEGTGTGKPTKTFDVVVGKYKETGAVADMIKWSCDFQISGDVVVTAQA